MTTKFLKTPGPYCACSKLNWLMPSLTLTSQATLDYMVEEFRTNADVISPKLENSVRCDRRKIFLRRDDDLLILVFRFFGTNGIKGAEKAYDEDVKNQRPGSSGYL